MTSSKRRRTPTSILSDMEFNEEHIDSANGPRDVCVVGRFAPSPSGRMHLGNIFSALMAWLSVRSQGGRMVLRIEDLDTRCHNPLWSDLFIEDLRWLGLDWDEGPFYQRDRTSLYEDALKKLIASGLTYPCFCTRAELHAASAPHASDGTPIYAGTCRHLSPAEVAQRTAVRPPATRLRVPEANSPFDTIEFVDGVYGEQCESLSSECGDFLIRRSDGIFAYQLAVVVDDAAMGVTEVVRGNDLLSSTPRQMYLQHLLGYPHPHYAHVPLLVAADGRRLSKRRSRLRHGRASRTIWLARSTFGIHRASRRHRPRCQAAQRSRTGRAVLLGRYPSTSRRYRHRALASERVASAPHSLGFESPCSFKTEKGRPGGRPFQVKLAESWGFRHACACRTAAALTRLACCAGQRLRVASAPHSLGFESPCSFKTEKGRPGGRPFQVKLAESWGFEPQMPFWGILA